MTIEQIKKLSVAYGIKPSKKFGQNFLIDEGVVSKIIEKSGVGKESRVLEIGPGFGILTKELLKVVDKLLVIEVDDRAISFLRSEFFAQPKIEIMAGDILKIRNEEIAHKLGENYEIVANIPYNITSPIIYKFLNYEPKPRSMTLMVQKEVAQRIAAEAGEMSILAISVQYFAKVSKLFDISNESFWPSPEVDSSVIKIEPYDFWINKTKTTQKEFFRAVKIGFSARRKKLANNLCAGLKISSSEALNFLKKAGLGANVRAQELTLDDWINLSALIFAQE